MMIQPKYLKLNELLNGRLFRIPPYQRAYSWEQKQRKDLFSDITRLRTANGDAVHFMATMVGLSRGKKVIATNEFQEIEVVDGQQRLTTLIILYKSLSLALDRDDKAECSFAAEIESLLVKGDDVSLLLLQTNHDTSHYFVTFLRDGTYPPADEAKTLADRLLLNTMKDCSDFVAEWEGSKLELGLVLKNKLALIFHEVDDEATVYSVFEVLNSRGLSVAWLDRLKSALMGTVFEYSEGDKRRSRNSTTFGPRSIAGSASIREEALSRFGSPQRSRVQTNLVGFRGRRRRSRHYESSLATPQRERLRSRTGF